MIDKAKSSFYKEKFATSDPKETSKLVNELLHPNKIKQLPSMDCPQKLADSFINFFTDKVNRICTILDNTVLPTPCNTNSSDPAHPVAVLDHFVPITPDELSKIIIKSPTKSSPLDVLPTWLLKTPSILECLVPHLTTLINASLRSGMVPSCLKTAYITPMLKKEGLDPNTLKHYRPVSNLAFLGKLMERVVSKQITEHMTKHNIQDPLQSAYKPRHGTESALIKIKNDIDMALDHGNGTLLILLDLSAAFDTLHHSILLQRLSAVVGIQGSALKWIESYLSNRSQFVTIRDNKSHPVCLKVGVPQGSVLGPLLFLTYVLPLQNVIDAHNVSRHGYADDTQLYTHFSMKDPASLFRAIDRLEKCVADVREWMTRNRLKLNDDKSELLLITSKKQLNKISEQHAIISIGNDKITPVSIAKNLGVIFHKHLDMTTHVNQIVKSAYFHLRMISKIRHHLDDQTAAKVIQSTVISRLDYNNAILAGATKQNISRLQLVQNNAARLLTKTKSREHISPVLQELHWLPISQRIKFRILVHVYNTLHDVLAPMYLKSMLPNYEPARKLRSADSYKQLIIPRTKTSSGDKAFACLAPRLWNMLPDNIKQSPSVKTFKKHLKTHLFPR
jgi:hypothetical protein